MAYISIHKRQMKIFGALLLLLVLCGCRLRSSNDDLSGRITLWHSWSPVETLILEEALAQFQEIHPDVQIITTAFPNEQMLTEFMDVGRAGLGPTLLLGTDSWISDLADTGLIRPIPSDLVALDLFNHRNLTLVQYHRDHFGIPLALVPRALYYNKSLISVPPTTLDELLQEAADGRSVAFVPRFASAYWGIQAFGEGLFDDQANFTLAESGFSEWLSWLNEAQSAPGVILNVDDESLLTLFASGQVAYYVAGPEVQESIYDLMDEENLFEVGVAPLPGNPDSPAGPLLSAEIVMFYAFASQDEALIAEELAAFLVNQQQSIRFLRELDRVPANPNVSVDPRVYPNVYGFAQQSRTSVVVPNEIAANPLVESGNRAYVNVLSGLLTPAEAVCDFGREVSETQGYTEVNMSVPEGCNLESDE